MDPEMMAGAAQGMSGDFSNLGGAIANYNAPNPYNSAMGYYNKIPGMLQNTYNPWIQGGMNAFNQYGAQNMALTNNPGQFINQVGSNFHASPGYNWDVGQAEQAVNHAAAAGGMAGSPEEQYNMGQNIMGMANQNYYQYLQNAMHAYGLGMQGLQNQANLGYRGANSLANNLGSAYMQQGNLAANQTQYGNNQKSDLYSSIASFM